MNIVIFEDEVYNFRMLRHQLLDINEDYDVIGPISSVEEGRTFLAYHHDIDLIIADIQLNDGLSFDALSYAPDDIPIIFTTAYDEYALKAFDFNSLSYLLKPIDDDELRKAVSKALRMRNAQFLVGKTQPESEQRFSYSSEKLTIERQEQETQNSFFRSMAHDAGHRYCFMVKTARGERRVHISMVRYAASVDKTTYIHLLDGSAYPVDITITDLAQQLPPKEFMRVNRKYIIPLEQVKGVEHLPNGRLQLILYGDDPPEILISRDMRKSVMEWVSR